MSLLRNTIRSKILISALLIPSLALICISVYTTLKLFSNVEEVKKDFASTLAYDYIDKIDRNLCERFGDVQAFASNAIASNAIMSPSNETYRQLLDYMNQVIPIYGVYEYSLVVDKSGKVVCINSRDRNRKEVNTMFFMENDLSKEPWFYTCINTANKDRKVWYSDFMFDTRAFEINGDSSLSYGIQFASTIFDENGNPVGVWLNFAGWKEIVQKIRNELEITLRKSYPNSFILLTDRQNKVIDSDSAVYYKKNFDFYLDDHRPVLKNRDGENLIKEKYLVSKFSSFGAYDYKGNGWNSYALIENAYSFGKSLLFEFTGILTLTLLCICGTVVLSYYTANSISRRIEVLKKSISNLAVGELNMNRIDGNDELSEINETLQKLTDNLKAKSEFAAKIGNQELSAQLLIAGEQDLLGKALVAMRDSLKKVAEEEQKRNWATEGLASFSELLRSKGTLEELCYRSLVKLITYTKANQGALFLVNDTDKNDIYLEMKACYAYNRKKYIDKKIYPKEGLVGQCYIEDEEIYLTEIPENYVYITSGIGGAKPKSLLLVPLKNNEHREGILEIASFREIEPFEIEFVKKVAENLASLISNAKINYHTQLLLEQTKQQTEEMRAQEEEMRQNMEELLATQEELSRRSAEKEMHSNFLKSLIQSLPFPVFIKDENGRYQHVNEAQCKLLGYDADTVLGKDDSFFIKNQNELLNIRKSDQTVLEKGESVLLPEQELHLPDGSRKILKTTKIPFFNHLAKKNHILGVSVDLTEIRDQHKLLQQEIEKLNNLLKNHA